jgi:predicted TIM-barrel fold metal-dependent hydrolase
MPDGAAAKIRAGLNHPIIDSDGHTVEFMPALLDRVENIAGRNIRQDLEREIDRIFLGWYGLGEAARRTSQRPPWWPTPTDPLDRATATLPRLHFERMPEFGIDFAVLYPGIGLLLPSLPDEAIRRGACRALNHYHAELYGPYASRLTPAAVIPMHTPEEAVEELHFAVQECGLKAVMLAGHVQRPNGGPGDGPWVDTLGHYSAYDYDPVWRACTDLGVSPTFHSSGSGWPGRASPTNYVHNHLGQFSVAGEATCRSLFFAGVLDRFPKLRFAFLEGGVGWACSLYSDLIGHWEKRNRDAIRSLDPSGLDFEAIGQLFERYSEPLYRDKLDQLQGSINFHATDELPELLDEFAGTGVEHVEDFRRIFESRLYFGCEGDDPTNAWAFDEKKLPFGARLGAIFSSDTGHWDVPEMNKVVCEVHELVEEQAITLSDLRDFVFGNPVSFWTAGNPGFFDGTDVEQAVRAERN